MNNEVPDYALDPLANCFDSVFTLSRLLHISMEGLRAVSDQPALLEKLIARRKRVGQKIPDKLNNAFKNAGERAEFAKTESDRGFPLLHAFTIVAFWGALESAVEDTLVGIMCNEPAVLEAPAFLKVRIPLSKYEQLNKEERMRFLLSEVQRDASGMAQGVNTFENILEIFGLSGPVNPEVKDALWNLNNLRNIIVHRDSRADRRFVENCPSLNFKLGERILIDHALYASVTDHIFSYIQVLLGRVGDRYGVKLPK